ncbi:DUF3515 family protein [Streptomyces noursei]|uniref:DUF3515 family protein n=1 Tax=Streptomyces noursei TaxID=1971 RepID=UPI00381F8863
MSLIVFWQIEKPPGFESAPNAGSPLCGKVEKGYPSKILGEGRSRVDARGVAVWGDSKVVLRCGVELPKGLQIIKVLLPVPRLVDVVCASRTRSVPNSS